ncbi:MULTISPECIES: hypothetical protein [unclassified Microcoleus]|nr:MULTISPECIES: hypothetical protein [unclassified Microcoleus]
MVCVDAVSNRRVFNRLRFQIRSHIYLKFEAIELGGQIYKHC